MKNSRAILKLIKAGRYWCDLNEGRIFGPSGKELTQIPKRGQYSSDKYLIVKMTLEDGRRIEAGVHQVIWIYGARHPIPRRWEIHHHDGNIYNNAWSNLRCLHPRDHIKEHTPNPEEIPF